MHWLQSVAVGQVGTFSRAAKRAAHFPQQVVEMLTILLDFHTSGEFEFILKQKQKYYLVSKLAAVCHHFFRKRFMRLQSVNAGLHYLLFIFS